MKNLFLFLFIALIANACSKTNHFEPSKDSAEKAPTYVVSDLGRMHNEMLDIYYSNNIDKSNQTLADKVAIIDAYFIENNISPLFSTCLDSIPQLQDYVMLVDSTNLSLQDYANLFSQYRIEGWSTEKDLQYQMEVISVLAEESGIDTKIDGITDIKQMIMVDTLLSEAIKTKYLSSMDICISSLEYWDNEQKGLPWYVKDMMGAVFALDSGAAAWGFLMGGGPAGAAAVMLGCAAIGSMV